MSGFLGIFAGTYFYITGLYAVFILILLYIRRYPLIRIIAFCIGYYAAYNIDITYQHNDKLPLTNNIAGYIIAIEDSNYYKKAIIRDCNDGKKYYARINNPYHLLPGDFISAKPKRAILRSSIYPGTYSEYFTYAKYYKAIKIKELFHHNKHICQYYKSDWLALLSNKMRFYIAYKIDVNAHNNYDALKYMTIGKLHDINDANIAKIRDIGLGHLLAISGLHVSIIIGMFVLVIKMFCTYFNINLRYSYIIGIILCIFYAFISGSSSSSVRASLMSGAIMTALAMRNLLSMRNALFSTGALMLYFNPSYAVHPGFMLSMLAVCVISMFIKDDLSHFKPIKSLIMSAAIFCITTPVIIFNFYHFNPISIPFNVILIPITACVVILVVIGAIFPYCGSLIVLADYGFSLIRYLASFGNPSFVGMAPYYAVLLCFVFLIVGCVYKRSIIYLTPLIVLLPNIHPISYIYTNKELLVYQNGGYEFYGRSYHIREIWEQRFGINLIESPKCKKTCYVYIDNIKHKIFKDSYGNVIRIDKLPALRYPYLTDGGIYRDQS